MMAAEVGKFDIDLAQRGYALNRMCFSLNEGANRTQFAADEPAYCDLFELSQAEADAVMRRDKPALFELGGNMYFLAKLDRVPKRTPAAIQE
jgi:protocatechuate 4,5-dioxygenase alpha subunit